MSSHVKGGRSKQATIKTVRSEGFRERMRARWIPDQATGISPMHELKKKKRMANLLKKRTHEGLQDQPEQQFEEVNRSKKEVEALSSSNAAHCEHSFALMPELSATGEGQKAPEAVNAMGEPQPSCFLNLPLEIKSEIYKLLLTPERKVLWTHTTPFLQKPDSGLISSQEPTKRYTAILRVSKQVHHEAATILYGYSQFIFFPYYHGLRYAVEMMIPTLPLRYRDLIMDVTLNAFDPRVPHHNVFIWTDNNAAARQSPRATRSCIRIDFSTGLFLREKWSAVRFRPNTSFEVEPLYKCRNLKNLTLELLPGLYALAWGGGIRGHRIEEVEGIRDLLKIRGLENLRVVDMGNVTKNFPEMTATKEKLETLLRAELLKPRRG